MRSLSILLILCLTLAGPALGKTIHVNSAGTGDYPTIQVAVNNAGDWDEVVLADGVYTGSGNRDITMNNTQKLVIRSANGPGACTINCENAGRAFYITGALTDSTLVIDGIRIINGDVTGDGGGIYCEGSPILRNLVVEDCRATNGGGISSETPRILFSTIRYNLADTTSGNGGGIESDDAIVAYCSVENNKAYDGGGIHGAAFVTFCDIIDNTAKNDGGGALALNCRVDNCEFRDNLAAFGGGFNGSGYIYNCLFEDNGTTNGTDLNPHRGGGVYNGPGGLQVNFCTFYHNYAQSYSAVYSASVYNSIIWANPANDLNAIFGSWSYTCISEGVGDIPGPPNFTSGPRGNRYLNPATSTLIDAGSVLAGSKSWSSAFGDYPLDRTTTRPDEAYDTGQADIGYHYRPEIGIVHVPGEFTTIGEALDEAAPMDTILVGDDTYIENIDFNGKAVHLISENGPAACVIQGDGLTQVVNFTNGEFGYSIIEGFTITGGVIGINCGGDVSPIIRGNVITQNTGGGYGGGIKVATSCPRIIGNTISDNSASSGGGGAWIFASEGTQFEDNVLYDNDPAGIDARQSRVDMYRNTIAHNGYGLYLAQTCYPWGENNIVTNNASGGIFCDANFPTRFKCNDVWLNGTGKPAVDNWVGGISDPTGTDGNIRQDPVYCNVSGENYRLHAGSPCAEANNPGCGQIGALDVGCGVTCETFVVKPDGTGDYATIQDAVNAAWDCYTILLADGCFQGPGNRDIDFKNKAITIRSQNGIAEACSIDCQGNSGDPHRAFLFDGSEGPDSRLMDITIVNGYADGNGGAIYCDGTSPFLDGLIIVGCHATGRGGGIYLDAAPAQIQFCDLYSNSSDDLGGGIACYGASEADIDFCRIVGNSGVSAGGVIFAEGSDGGMMRCLVAENTGRWGAGIYISESSPLIQYATVTRNVCVNGGAAFSIVSSTPTIILSIIAFNRGGTAPPVYCTGSSVTASCLDSYGNQNGDYTGCLSGLLGVDGNISANPLFCDTLSGEYTLHEDSPCALPNNPFCGGIGAYDTDCFPICPTIIVKPDGTGDYPTIQDAIDAAWDCCNIVLADGGFRGPGNRDIDFKNKGVDIRSQSGTAAACTIDCQGNSGDPHRAFLFDEGEDNDSRLINITIINGYADGDGGAIYCSGSSPVLWSVVITGCHATGNGGGIYFEDSAAEIWTSEIYSNSCDGAGGGIACYDTSAVEIRSTRIIGNAGASAGGFIFAEDSHGLLAGCLVAENTGRWGAGGYISESSPVISECTFAHNVCERGGSALSVVSSNPIFDLTIFAFNRGGTAAPLYCTGSSVTATCIDVYGNDNGDYVDCLSGLLGVDGNISADPLFCDTLSGDYTLHEDSPCAPANNPGGWKIGAYHVGCYNPTNDFIGVYTTHDGQTVDQIEAVLYEEVDIHLMLISPSDTSGVLAYECGLTVSPNVDVVSFTPSQPGYIMIGEVPGQLVISYMSGSALPSSEYAWLGTLRCRLTAADTGYVYLAPHVPSSCNPPAPCYITEENPTAVIPLNISSGSETAPVFTLVPEVMTDVQETPAAAMYSLGQNYPNPFNPSTTISFQLAAGERVSLLVFDVAGRQVRSLVSGEVLEAGPHTATWNGRNDQGTPVASGVYYYRLQAGKFTETRAMVLLK